mmetsp:Transcript_1042/g.4296  ORF Transcript_1042/g.4296 Transcript_1042/m.4296 type:complete len:736 (-) Transcript_1042:451-2658(-)
MSSDRSHDMDHASAAVGRFVSEGCVPGARLSSDAPRFGSEGHQSSTSIARREQLGKSSSIRLRATEWMRKYQTSNCGGLSEAEEEGGGCSDLTATPGGRSSTTPTAPAPASAALLSARIEQLAKQKERMSAALYGNKLKGTTRQPQPVRGRVSSGEFTTVVSDHASAASSSDFDVPVSHAERLLPRRAPGVRTADGLPSVSKKHRRQSVDRAVTSPGLESLPRVPSAKRSERAPDGREGSDGFKTDSEASHLDPDEEARVTGGLTGGDGDSLYQREVQAITRVADAHKCQVFNTRTDVQLKVASTTAAVLVVGDLSHIARAHQVAQNSLLEAQARPVIAVVVGCSLNGRRSQVLEVQHKLLSCGFDDVICSGTTEGDFDFALLLSITRARSFRDLGTQVSTLKQRLQKLEAARSNGLFWLTVDKLYQEFPALRKDLSSAPEPGAEIGGRWLDQRIGQGSTGSVYSATNVATGLPEVVKVIPKSTMLDLREVESVWRELLALKKLQHRHVVELKQALHGPDHIFIFMELGGQLNLAQAMHKLRGPLSVQQAQVIQAQLASVLLLLKDAAIVHRDLKPENIAVDAHLSDIKVLDFGNAISVRSTCSRMAGTMPFIAPEVLESDNVHPYKPGLCDVWSSSIILMEMLCGVGKINRMLGWSKSPKPCRQRCEELTIFFREPHKLKASLLDCLPNIEICLLEYFICTLKPDPDHRWNAQEVCASPWISSSQLDNLTDCPR